MYLPSIFHTRMISWDLYFNVFIVVVEFTDVNWYSGIGIGGTLRASTKCSLYAG